jgi:hypothetical protein
MCRVIGEDVDPASVTARADLDLDRGPPPVPLEPSDDVPDAPSMDPSRCSRRIATAGPLVSSEITMPSSVIAADASVASSNRVVCASRRRIADWFVPSRRASSRWLQPNAVLAVRIADAMRS